MEPSLSLFGNRGAKFSKNFKFFWKQSRITCKNDRRPARRPEFVQHLITIPAAAGPMKTNSKIQQVTKRVHNLDCTAQNLTTLRASMSSKRGSPRSGSQIGLRRKWP